MEKFCKVQRSGQQKKRPSAPIPFYKGNTFQETPSSATHSAQIKNFQNPKLKSSYDEKRKGYENQAPPYNEPTHNFRGNRQTCHFPLYQEDPTRPRTDFRANQNTPNQGDLRSREIVPEYQRTFKRIIDFQSKDPKGDRTVDKIVHKSWLIRQRDSSLYDKESNFRLNRLLAEIVEGEKKDNFLESNSKNINLNFEKKNFNFKKTGKKNILISGKSQDDKIEAIMEEKRRKQVMRSTKMQLRENHPISLKISDLRSSVRRIIQTQKMKVKNLDWLEDEEFLMDCYLGLQNFNLCNSEEFEKLGIFNHGLNDGTSILDHHPELKTRIQKISEINLKGIKLNFDLENEYAKSKVTLPSRTSNFIKNFFGTKFYWRIKNKNTQYKEKSHNFERSVDIENVYDLPSGGVLRTGSNFSWEKLLKLSANDILSLAAQKDFLHFVQQNWENLKKSQLLKLIFKLRENLYEMCFTKNHNTFVYFLLKIDFSRLDNYFMLYEDYCQNVFDSGIETNNKTPVFENFEEVYSETIRMLIREEFIEKIIIKDFDEEFYKSNISVRTFQKFLKDEIMCERIKKSDEYFQKVEFNNFKSWIIEVGESAIPHRKIQKKAEENLNRMIIPKKSKLLNFVINFTNQNFTRYKNSIHMTKTLLTLIDFLDIKLVSYNDAKSTTRSVVVQRLKQQDENHLKKLDPITNFVLDAPRELLEKNQINKGLVSLITKLPNEILFKIFFSVSDHLSDMISCRHNNYLVQEVLERLEAYSNHKKFQKLDFESIIPGSIKIMTKGLKKFRKKMIIAALEVKKWIRETFLLNFDLILKHKFAKYVVCSLLEGEDSLRKVDDALPRPLKIRYMSQDEFLEKATDSMLKIESKR